MRLKLLQVKVGTIATLLTTNEVPMAFAVETISELVAEHKPDSVTVTVTVPSEPVEPSVLAVVEEEAIAAAAVVEPETSASVYNSYFNPLIIVNPDDDEPDDEPIEVEVEDGVKIVVDGFELLAVILKTFALFDSIEVIGIDSVDTSLSGNVIVVKI
ncbi:hypothetical protein WICMUC_000776 [Wickerhamomyces mucosus]|uniref:Uncharacterized protein n=1 Tax=Wickerhamomyces mucosus TaxID=1378264 RepID=A0A9P8PWH0_9ASCO|nr:hypothetical protein WICMUC_000776 [Wickerhamomyces mucosus]